MKNLDILQLKSIAIENAREGITLCDARLPDCPLIYSNKGFTLITGYSAEEALGKNCRFLQGPETDMAEIASLGVAILNRKTILKEIVNYKKDGTKFWNKLSITPLFNEANELTHFVGVQEDITVKKEKEALDLKLANYILVNKTMLIAEEKQRKEIGEELHDNVNQLLATIKLYLNMASLNVDMRTQMVTESEALLIIAMEEIRKLSKSLVGIDIKETLEDSLTALVHSVKIGVSFTIDLFVADDIEKELTQTRKVMFYRIIQEQLNNIVKYAKPTAVTIRILQEDNYTLLSVKDNGVGFNQADAVEGIGLRNMMHRAEIENGCLSILTSTGNGCEIRVKLPLEVQN